MGSDAGVAAEYQAVAGGSVTVYVDSGKALVGPTLGGAGYSRVRECVCVRLVDVAVYHCCVLSHVSVHSEALGFDLPLLLLLLLAVY